MSYTERQSEKRSVYMKKKFPLPIVGVCLGMAALGNLWQGYSVFRCLCGIVSLCLGIIFLLDYGKERGTFAQEAKNPIMASVFATFPMAGMILSTYLVPVSKEIAFYIWYGAIGLHILVILFFTLTFMRHNSAYKSICQLFYCICGNCCIKCHFPHVSTTKSGADCLSLRMAQLSTVVYSHHLSLCERKRCTGTGEALNLYLCRTGQLIVGGIFKYLSHTDIYHRHAVVGHFSRGLLDYCHKTSSIIEITLLSQLCRIYFPLCHIGNGCENGHGIFGKTGHGMAFISHFGQSGDVVGNLTLCL